MNIRGLMWMAALAALGTCPDLARAGVNFTESQHFVISYLDEDVGAGKVTRKLIESTKEWLELSYERYVNQHQYKPPFGQKLHGRHQVDLRYFDKPAHGFVRRADGIVNLNLRSFRRHGTYSFNKDKLLMPATTCHELFHAVQFAYDPQEDGWLVESTARFAESLVYPDLHYSLVQEALFLRFPYYPMHYPTNGMNLQTGRPYGGSVFFRFVARHHPDGTDVVRQIWAEAARVPGGNGMKAVIDTLNRRGPEEFRGYLARFAAGALLLEYAPPECQLADANLLRRARYTDLGPLWAKHYAHAFADPDSASLLLPFDAAEAPARRKDGAVAGMGTRYFRIPRPPQLPEDTDLAVAVPGGPQELILQGMARHADRWIVYPAQYDAASQSHVLRIPQMDKAVLPAFLALTRVDIEQPAKAFPLRVAAANPPILREAAVSQKGQPVLRKLWQPVRSPTGLLERREPSTPLQTGVKAENGPAELTLTFSQPVAARAGKPLARLNGQPLRLESADDGRTWRGQAGQDLLRAGGDLHKLLVDAESRPPGTQAVMPLDQDPRTAACVTLGGWKDYERAADGMEVPLEGGQQPKFSVAWQRRFRNGPVMGKILLAPPAKEGDWGIGVFGEPYLIVAKLGSQTRYLYGSNVQGVLKFGMRPELSFETFQAPPRLPKALPDNLELTAVFASGRRVSQTAPMEYQGAAEEFAADWEKIAQDARQKRQQALALPANTPDQKSTRLGQVVGASTNLLEWTMDPAEADTVWETALGMGPNKNQINALRTGRMKGNFYRRDAKIYVEMLKALREDGAYPEPGHYIECMTLLVNMNNDVAGAWQVWDWYKADGAKWTDAVKKRYHYDENVRFQPALPRQPIQP
ncbi:MAG: hypothetical protein HZA50_03300 [Planctomycetes bacterium]|nr:hypothetical protein [Planctomycetota bacterium]